MNLISITLLLLFLSLPGFSKIPPHYRLAETCAFMNSGILQLLVDEAITREAFKEQWRMNDWDSPEPRPAMLRWVAIDGSVRATLNLERPLARLDSSHSVANEPPRVTVDYGIGSGSYNGPITRWVIPKEGRLQWVKAKDASGEDIEVSVMDSLKTAWRRIPRKDGSLDIYEIACRPNFTENPSSDEEETFRVIYTHIRFARGTWSSMTLVKEGFWEADEDFPSETLFP